MKVIAVGGFPAVGKTTIFKKLLNKLGDGKYYCWKFKRPFIYKSGTMKGKPGCSLVRIEFLYYRKFKVVVLGTYGRFLNEEKRLEGLDSMDRIVYQVLDRFLKKLFLRFGERTQILFEGDRLFGQKGIEILEQNKYVSSVKLYMIVAKELRIRQRHINRKDKQTERYIKSLETKNNNMFKHFPNRIQRLKNNSLRDIKRIANKIFRKII